MSKTWWLSLVAVAAIGAGFLSIASAETDATKAAPAKSASMEQATMMKSTYLVISPHTAEECMASLDAVAAMGPESLKMWEWGCQSGDHTGYAFVQASSEEEALKAVPESIRAKAHAVKVDRYTLEQIKALHQMHD